MSEPYEMSLVRLLRLRDAAVAFRRLLVIDGYVAEDVPGSWESELAQAIWLDFRKAVDAVAPPEDPDAAF